MAEKKEDEDDIHGQKVPRTLWDTPADPDCRTLAGLDTSVDPAMIARHIRHMPERQRGIDRWKRMFAPMPLSGAARLKLIG